MPGGDACESLERSVCSVNGRRHFRSITSSGPAPAGVSQGQVKVGAAWESFAFWAVLQLTCRWPWEVTLLLRASVPICTMWMRPDILDEAVGGKRAV